MPVRSVGPLVAAATILAALFAHAQAPRRASFDERFERIEERLAALEEEVVQRPDPGAQDPGPGRLALESEAKLDRLEVRVIQLETQPPECDCATAQLGLASRVRSLERQLARLRAGLNR